MQAYGEEEIMLLFHCKERCLIVPDTKTSFSMFRDWLGTLS